MRFVKLRENSSLPPGERRHPPGVCRRPRSLGERRRVAIWIPALAALQRAATSEIFSHSLSVALRAIRNRPEGDPTGSQDTDMIAPCMRAAGSLWLNRLGCRFRGREIVSPMFAMFVLGCRHFGAVSVVRPSSNMNVCECCVVPSGSCPSREDSTPGGRPTLDREGPHSAVW